MLTQLLYLRERTKTQCVALVIGAGSDELGAYVILDQTVFYPQGGGQPSDRGFMTALSEDLIETSQPTQEVTRVLLRDGSVYHYFGTLDPPFQVGQAVSCKIEFALRALHSAAHTAGHLICACVESLNPHLKSKKGFHFLEGPYIEFEGPLVEAASAPDLLQAINIKLSEALQTSACIKVNEDIEKNLRTIQIGDYPPLPCGGTHLAHLGQLAVVKVTKLKNTKTGVRMSYRFERKA